MLRRSRSGARGDGERVPQGLPRAARGAGHPLAGATLHTAELPRILRRRHGADSSRHIRVRVCRRDFGGGGEPRLRVRLHDGARADSTHGAHLPRSRPLPRRAQGRQHLALRQRLHVSTRRGGREGQHGEPGDPVPLPRRRDSPRILYDARRRQGRGARLAVRRGLLEDH